MQSDPRDLKNVGQDILIRYYAGECNMQERRAVETLLLTNTGERLFAQSFLRAMTYGSSEVGHRDVLKSLAHVKSTRLFEGGDSPPLSMSPISRMPRRRYQVVTAVACLTLVLGGMISYTRSTSTHDGPPYSVQMREYVTPKAQQASVTLPDGTIVMLNVDSRLRVPSSFGQKQRVVYLDGEAQFTVVHSTGMPFSVHASGTLIRDLGTVFSIRAYPNQTETHIAVSEGRVSVLSPALTSQNAVVLAQGDIAHIAAEGTIDVEQNVAVDDMVRWTTGQLIFLDQSVGDVLTQLGRWYDIEFRINDTAILHRRVDLTIPDQRWGPEVLESLSGILRARGTQIGKVVTFTSETQ